MQRTDILPFFVDNKQTFDLYIELRTGLWNKMHFYGLSGIIQQGIQNVYKGIKSILIIYGISSDCLIVIME